MQCFDPPIHDLRKPGQLIDFFYRQAVLPEQLGGAAGRNDLHPQGIELAGEIDHAGLVRHTDQCAPDGLCIGIHGEV